MKMAASALMAQCYSIGTYNPMRRRRRGAWFDEGRVVINNGRHLVINGERVHYRDYEGRFLYTAGVEMEMSTPSPLIDGECAVFLKLAEEFNWQEKDAGKLLAGWCAIAPICGALGWRPHLYLTGGPGSGKSTVHPNTR